ncbi:MAG: hypothetical protein WCI11_18940 [Candidatus Methylumidiphilus sp.]
MQIIGYIANSGWHDDLMNLYDKLILANKELDNYQTELDNAKESKTQSQAKRTCADGCVGTSIIGRKQKLVECNMKTGKDSPI